MSVIAAALRELMAAGVTGDALAAAIERIEDATDKRSPGAKRQARYRARQASQSVISDENVTSDAAKERKVSAPSKERNTLPSDSSNPQSEFRAVAVATRPSVELGKQVSKVLRSLGPQPDEAKSLHDAAETALRAAFGISVIREFAIRLGDRFGYIDLVVDDGQQAVAIELDRRMPRAKSLTKLAAFDGYRIAVTRTEIPANEFVGLVDEVISVPPIGGMPVSRDQVFEEFWRAYPKREGANPKEPARKLFVAALKAGTEASEIVSGARACAARDRDKIGTPYIPQAVKWLRDRRWTDYAPVTSGTDPPPEARGWRPGMPTSEELRRKYENQKSGGQAEILGSGGAAREPEPVAFRDRSEGNTSGMAKLGSLFPRLPGLDPDHDEARKAADGPNGKAHDAGPMA